MEQTAKARVTKIKKDPAKQDPAPREKTEPRTMKELFSQTGYSFRTFKKGQQTEGVISSISGREILIDLNGKTEGVVGSKEWEEIRDFVATLKVGDKVACYVISSENEQGQTVLSLRRAGWKFKWDKIREAMKVGTPLTVRGIQVNKGGVIVDIMALQGFIPASQLSSKWLGKIQTLVNRLLLVKAIEVDEEQKRLIFSEKAVGEAKEIEERKKILDLVKAGEIYEGKITGIVPYGLFVAITPKEKITLDGLIHISEISWEKVESPEKMFKTGQKIKVLLLGADEQSGKLSLSIKQLTADPWTKLAKKYAKDQKIKGTVSRVAPYGVFVKLAEGIEGLIHITKIPPEKILNIGETVECLVEELDLGKHKISLSLLLKEKPVGYR